MKTKIDEKIDSAEHSAESNNEISMWYAPYMPLANINLEEYHVTVRNIVPNTCRRDPEKPRRLLVECAPLRYTGKETCTLFLEIKAMDLMKLSRNKADHDGILNSIVADVNKRGTIETPLWKNKMDSTVFSRK